MNGIGTLAMSDRRGYKNVADHDHDDSMQPERKRSRIGDNGSHYPPNEKEKACEEVMKWLDVQNVCDIMPALHKKTMEKFADEGFEVGLDEGLDEAYEAGFDAAMEQAARKSDQDWVDGHNAGVQQAPVIQQDARRQAVWGCNEDGNDVIFNLQQGELLRGLQQLNMSHVKNGGQAVLHVLNCIPGRLGDGPMRNISAHQRFGRDATNKEMRDSLYALARSLCITAGEEHMTESVIEELTADETMNEFRHYPCRCISQDRIAARPHPSTLYLGTMMKNGHNSR